MSQDPDPEHPRRAEAARWAARLDGPALADAEHRDFTAWRSDPQNLQAWEALAGRARVARFVVRAAADGCKVVDIWTGETAVIAMIPQDGLSAADAQHTARLLNRRAEDGDRSLPQ